MTSIATNAQCGQVIAAVTPNIKMPSYCTGILHRDQKAVQARDNDPLIVHETQPTQTVAELVRADERLKERVPLIATSGGVNALRRAPV